MGEYFKIANIDRKEFIHPHRFGHGMKKWEVAVNAPGAISALAMLISTPAKVVGRLSGSWAGDRIIMVGDYSAESKLYEEMEDDPSWKDISKEIIEELTSGDKWMADRMKYSP